VKYAKPALTFFDQADLLLKRGLVAPGRQAIIEKLQAVSYYRLSADWYPFRQSDDSWTVNHHSLRQRRLTCVLLVATLGFAPEVRADGRSVNDPPTDTTPVYDIPYARGISIDGDGADWNEAGFRVEFMPDMDGITQPKASFEPRFRAAWDKRGLLLLLKVLGDIIVESADESLPGERNSVEVLVGTGRGSSE
jgi:hypothetical protein